MKKILLMLAIILGTSVASSAAGGYRHDPNVLPAAAQTTLKRNFKADVSLVKTDRTLGRVTEYEVILTDGTEISFDRSGNWKDVEVRRGSEVPKAFIPDGVKAYVNQYQKGARIVGVEKRRGGYDVELSNGVEMKFSSDGRFQRYDD